MHRKLITDVISSNDLEKLKKIADLEIDTIDMLKDYSKDDYEYVETELYEIVEGKRLNEEMAKEWVNNMKPKSKWTMNDIISVKNRLNVDIPIIDLFVIMNMLYTDFGNVLGEDNSEETIERYTKAANDWYYDEDSGLDGSVKLYKYKKNVIM